MKRYYLSFMLLIFCLTFSFAQREETIFGVGGFDLTGAWGGPLTSIASFDGDNALFRGGFGGLEFNRSLFIGWGGMSLQDEVQLEGAANQLIDVDMKFNGLMLGYAFKQNKVIHPMINLHTGTGHLRFEGIKDNIYVIQPSAGININIFRWFHLSAEGGYRFVNGVDQNEFEDSDLSVVYGELKFKFGWSWGY